MICYCLYFIYKVSIIEVSNGGDEMSGVQQKLRDGRVVALVEQLKNVDALYGITPEERNVLDVIHGITDIAEETEE